MVTDGQHILTYLLTAVVLTPGDSSTVHIYTQTIYRKTQLTTYLSLPSKTFCKWLNIHCLYLISKRTQLSEHYVFICRLQHVLAVWPLSAKVTTHLAMIWRAPQCISPLMLLWFYLMMAKRPKHVVHDKWVQSVLSVVFTLTLNTDID